VLVLLVRLVAYPHRAHASVPGSEAARLDDARLAGDRIQGLQVAPFEPAAVLMMKIEIPLIVLSAFRRLSALTRSRHRADQQ